MRVNKGHGPTTEGAGCALPFSLQGGKEMKGFRLVGSDGKLSDTLSKAIGQCLEDLVMVEKHRRYGVSMRHWHTGTHNMDNGTGVCLVCLGGARLARIFDCEKFDNAPVGLTDSREAGKIQAMDYVRKGDIFSALCYFHGKDSLVADPLPCLLYTSPSPRD